MPLLVETTIFLAAMVIAVPLSKRLGLGAVLGYLIAGVAIGPWGLGLVGEVESVLHFAEIGVVLLLFVIGLELEPSRLWVLRKAVFGLGAAQMFLTATAFALITLWFDLPASTAVIVGTALAMSSTAFALQTLAERKELTARHGRNAFAILLFQDLAAIPLLALIPLFAVGANGDFSMLNAIKVIAVLAAVVIGGRYLLRPLLRMVAAVRIQEVFTAVALLTVLGAALIVQAAGISMELGAFIAGVLLADSEYRHELEADIEPFRGLLLGLFFIAVGMSANIGLIEENPLLIFGLAAGMLLTKFLLLFGIARIQGAGNRSARNLGVIISQGGEFAFVIFAVAADATLIARDVADLLIVVVTLSMAATPLLLMLNDRSPAPARKKPAEFDRPKDEDNPVIIAGFGRFGQIVARILRARKIGFTALEISSEQVDFVRAYGNKIYYGDASRLELLRAARTGKAKLFVLAIDDAAASLRTAETVRKHFPEVTIYARARNRKHAYQLMDLGITLVWRETFLSSLDMARGVLNALGLSGTQSERAVATFRTHDEARLIAHHAMHNDEQRMIYLAQRGAEELEQLFEQDASEEQNVKA